MKNVYSKSFESTPPPQNINDCRAFTLAEVLITLGIIGVVAALTLPSLVANYRKKIVVNKLKHVYSLFSQAIKLSEVENGPIYYWDWNIMGPTASCGESENFANTYIYKYLKGITKTNHKQNYIGGMWTPKTINGGVVNSGCKVHSLNGYHFAISPSDSNGLYKTGLILIIDIDGNSGKDEYGKDVFAFHIHRDYGFTSFRGNYDTQKLDRTYGCNKNSTGASCARMIIKDGWEIKEDYPIKF